MRLDYDRLYIVGSSVKDMTHLAYKDKWSDCISQVCLPNLPVYMHQDGCCSQKKCECEGIAIGQEQAEHWDEHYNEVTCPTCLKRAAG